MITGSLFLFFTLLLCGDKGEGVPVIGVSVMNFSISAINCNSLNNSVGNKKLQNLKIYGITALKTDIIFLSDIRLSNRNLISCANDVSKIFLTNQHGQYEFFYNSTKNSRGTGILIKKNFNMQVIDRWDEPGENALLLKISKSSGETFTLGSIYGPNENNPEFFNSLRDKLSEWNTDFNIIGGDFNCLFSTDPVNANIDCFRMTAAPNRNNSLAVQELCEQFNLTDPYRYLFPEKVDFTYIPRDKQKKNRSRLDFFLVSALLLPYCHESYIKPMLQNSLFDHKAVGVVFKDRNVFTGPKKFMIKNSLLNIDILSPRIELVVAETYLLHSVELPQHLVEEKLAAIGNIKVLCLDAHYSYDFWPLGDFDEADILRRALKIERIAALIANLNIPEICSLQLSVDNVVFYEVLLNNIRNEIISTQVHFLKWKKKSINSMTENLKRLKIDYNANFERIFDIESRLNSIFDMDAKKELEKFEIFEILNMEKMTPNFLALVKQTKSEAALSDIKDDNGLDFRTNKQREDYIVNYYKDIYSIKPETTGDFEGCIEDFLGPEILAIPEVRNSKLSPEQSAMLDRDLELFELDNALRQMNSKSAGGPDGFGVPAFKKFWHLLRKPLFNYYTDMMRLEKISDSFLVSSIKLIPKKGDCSKIKNWRPISLLNVGYKIISKAINNRLKKVSGTILSRAQKGFTNKKYIQECLINILESVAYCEKNSTQGFMLAIDQAKAFDTVSQKFIHEVYKFFGFGATFIKLLETTTMGRHACILFENGKLSAPLPLNTGFTQGNAPSPLQFNFCEQIFIFKLEYDSRIKSLDWHNLRLFNENFNLNRQPPIMDQAGPPQLQHQQQQQPLQPPRSPEPGQQLPGGKVEGFADDATVLGKADRVALRAIKEILVNFARISGLKANFDKCILVPLGFNNGDIPDFFNESGFTVANSAKILGCEIFNTFNECAENFNMIIAQLIKIRNFWARFNLSLPGRLAVAKSLMLSKVSYIGCFLNPDPEQCRQMEEIIFSFVKGKLNVSQARITAPTALGGLGMIDLKLHLKAQKVSWLKRATESNDLWADVFKNCGVTDPDNFTADPFPAHFPVLNCIASDCKDFAEVFLQNKNLIASRIHLNPIVNTGLPVPVNRESFFFAAENPETGALLATWTFADILDDLRIRSHDELMANLGRDINPITYDNLLRNGRHAISLLRRNTTDFSNPKKIFPFLKSIKKGSKLIRQYFNEAKYGNKVLNLSSLKKFASLVNLPSPVPELISFRNTLWSLSGLTNKCKEFIFKFQNNLLGLNTRVHNFNRLISEECTFCMLKNIRPVQRESFLHLFFDCPETNQILLGIEASILSDLHLNTGTEKKTFWFWGKSPLDICKDGKIFLQLTSILFMFYVWECKLKKSALSVMSAKNFYFFYMDTFLKVCQKQKIFATNSALLICRRWNEQRR
jgi:exonuclease III